MYSNTPKEGIKVTARFQGFYSVLLKVVKEA